MNLRTYLAYKLLTVFLLTSLFGCGLEPFMETGKDTKTIELQNGLDLVVTIFSWGLNGQHKRLVLSKDTLQRLEVEPPTCPVFSGYTRAFLFDTVPAAIFYAAYEPKNVGTFDQFDGKLIFEEVGGSDLYFMSKSGYPNLINID